MWPTCTRCGKEAKPGVTCDRTLCPFRRVDGVITL
jgi:hypothetical protein